jgi:hypothetical protein
MTTDNSATQEDGAAIKNGQRVLGEVCEQLRDLAEGSNEWLETIMVAVGLFLLAIAAKAPKEMEVLGLKVDIEDVPKTFFLGILAFALLFRIVQGWVMARLSSDAIDAKFGEVREMLMALRDRLEERMAGHRHAAELAFERGRQEVQLDELTGLFDASTLLACCQSAGRRRRGRGGRGARASVAHRSQPGGERAVTAHLGAPQPAGALDA